MGNFRPKELLQLAQEEERRGSTRQAAVNYGKVGVYLLRAKRFSEAEVILNRAVKLSPQSARMFLHLSRCEFELGKELEARQSMGNFVQIIFSKQRVASYTTHVERELATYPALRQFFYEAILKVDRTSAEPFLSLARAFREQGKWRECREILLDALKTKTLREQCLEMLHVVISEQGTPDELGHLDRFAQDKISRAELIVLLGGAAASATAEAKPEFLPREKTLKDLISELEEEIDDAVVDPHDSVDGLVKEFRRRAHPILNTDAKARIDMALAFYEMGLYADARDELRKVSSLDPLYPEAQCLSGEVLIAEGSDLAALEVFQSVLRTEGLVKEVWLDCRYRLAQIYVRLGDLRRAGDIVRELEKKASQYRDVKGLRRHIDELSGRGPQLPTARKKAS